MLIIGLLSILQIVYLPGALLRRCFPLNEGDPLERAAYTFGLSLIANTWMVAILVALKAYSKPVLWAVILAELTMLLFLALGSAHRYAYVSWDLSGLASLGSPRSFNAVLGTILALTTIAIFGYICYLNWGTVFSENDDVASWDRWAMEWATGIFPTRASWYPQLIPANWSISYVLLGRADVKMFAKAITPLYPLLTLFLFCSLAAARRSAAFLFGAAMYGWLLLHNLGIAFMMLGYADVPVAFFGFLSFHAIYRKTEATLSRDDVLLSLLFATGTVMTKQGGVYALIAALLYALWVARKRPEVGPFTTRNSAAVITLFALCFTAVWYGGKALQIYGGHDYSNFKGLTQDLHHGRTYGQRLVAAGALFWRFRGDAGPPVACISALLLTGSLLFRASRWITLLLILPFLLAWGLLFSYEIRNASLVFPLVALVSGIVIERIFSAVMKPLDPVAIGSTTVGGLVAVAAVLGLSGWVLMGKPGISMAPAWAIRFESNEWIAYALDLYSWGLAAFGLIALLSVVVVVQDRRLAIQWPIVVTGSLVLIAAFATGKYRADAVVANQHILQRRIGSPAVNERIYAAVRERAIHRPIMTDYWYLRSLPDLESLFRPLPCGAPCSYEGLKAAAASHQDAGYFLMYDHDYSPDTLARLLASRGFHTIFTESGLRMMEINREALDTKNRAPEVNGVHPASGTGGQASFRFAYSDPDGSSDISSVIVIVNDALTSTKACYFQWYRATNTVTIANDNGVGWADEQKVGFPVAIHNSQCELRMSGTSMAEVGDRLELTFDLRFLTPFKGVKHLFTSVADEYNATSGYHDVASWDVK
jgi:hypothetical protein